MKMAMVCLGALVMIFQAFAYRNRKASGRYCDAGRGGTFYFPIVTCILLSVLASFVMWLINRR